MIKEEAEKNSVKWIIRLAVLGCECTCILARIHECIFFKELRTH